jgi:hypothetical protein
VLLALAENGEESYSICLKAAYNVRKRQCIIVMAQWLNILVMAKYSIWRNGL